MKLRKFVATGLALIAALFVIGVLKACTPLSPSEKRAEAAAAYEAQQMACVDQYADTGSIDRCRARVKAAWATDGGADASKDGAP